MFRGAPWEIAVHIPERGGGDVLLDLPELVYYEEPVSAEVEGEKITLELPFGLGPIELAQDGLRLVGTSSIGEERLDVVLHRTERNVRSGRREVEVPTPNGVLKGTLLLPPGKGPFPAVVIAHGSGPSLRTRWEYRSNGVFYARRGYAALIYDKRDPTADLSDLARDVGHCFEFLKTQPEVVPTRIGMMGGSQAAWLIAAVAPAARPSFIHLNSAPAETPREVEFDATALRVRANGGDATDESIARTYLGLYFAAAMTGRNIEAVQAEADLLPEEDWTEVLPIPAGYDELQWWRRNADFGKGTLWKGIDCPVLLLYGERDTAVPPLKSGPMIRELLLSSGNRDVTMRLFRGADHRLEASSGFVDNRWRWPRMADGYVETVEEWLRMVATSR